MEPTPGTFMTVPAPSQSGEVSSTNDYSNAVAMSSNGNGLANQEVQIAKIQNAMSILEDQNLTNDPRYQKMSELHDRLQGRTPIAPGSHQHHENVPPTSEQRKKLVDQLRAQVSAYRMTRSGEAIPSNILAQATAQVAVRPKVDGLPPPFQIPCEIGDGQQLPYDIAKLHAMMVLTASRRAQALPTPKSIDPNLIAKEREQRISTRIMTKIKELSELPSDLPENIRVKAAIQLHG
uniref:Uncharacterized protein n=1 Tax=Panagrolaimus sp. ES5 TaxID=591445 RepID=A0AC34G172_9BILA